MLLAKYDKHRTGGLLLAEFVVAMRKGAELTRGVISDAELGRLFGKVLADATQLLAQFCTQTAGLIKAGSVPPAAAGGGGGAERKIQIMRTPVRQPLAAPAPPALCDGS